MPKLFRELERGRERVKTVWVKRALGVHSLQQIHTACARSSEMVKVKTAHYVHITVHCTFVFRMLAEGPRLSDISPPTMMSSYSQPGQQHGMTTHETHSMSNHQVPPHPQSGMGTQQFLQNGIETQPQYTGMQPQATFQSLPPQSGIGTQLQTGMGMQQSGMGTQVQHGMGTQVQHGTGTQQHGMFPGQQSVLMSGVQQNGMTTAPPQTGMGTEHQYTVYSTNPRQYTTTHEVMHVYDIVHLSDCS